MKRYLAINNKGQVTYCTMPPELRGKGRCNHISHKYELESKEQFLERNKDLIKKQPLLEEKINKNIKLLKNNIEQLVFSSSLYEYPGLTFLDTKNLIKGLKENNVPEDKKEVITALNSAYKALANNPNGLNMLNLDDIKSLSYSIDVGEDSKKQNYIPGTLRWQTVGITGLDGYHPDDINEDFCKSELERIKKYRSPIQKALRLFCTITRNQWFNNSNKRTAELAANYILAQNGEGIFLIPTNSSDRRKFTDNLLDFYESNNEEKFIRYAIKHCIIND